MRDRTIILPFSAAEKIQNTFYYLHAGSDLPVLKQKMYDRPLHTYRRQMEHQVSVKSSDWCSTGLFLTDF